MIAQMMLAGAQPPAGPSGPPEVFGVTVTNANDGSCAQSQNAILRVSWGLNNPNAALYQIKVYEDGVLLDGGTIAGDSVFFDKDVGALAYPENPDLFFTFEANWTYRVDVVRLSDGQVISSATSSMWIHDYGYC